MTLHFKEVVRLSKIEIPSRDWEKDVKDAEEPTLEEKAHYDQLKKEADERIMAYRRSQAPPGAAL